MSHSFKRANDLWERLHKRERREVKRLVSRHSAIAMTDLEIVYRRYDRLKDECWNRYGP